MRKKEHYLIVDVETCNTLEEPLPYDIGYCICDRNGEIKLKRSFVVADVFCDMQDVMQSAYYKEKIPQYWEDLKNRKRELRSYYNIRQIVLEDMKNYGVKTVGAYNMSFDRKALNNLVRYCSKSYFRYFFPFGTKYICIWHMACQVLMARKTYIDFAEKNGLLNARGNIHTTAESCYKYVKKNLDFVESHTGLEDVEIETEILAECFRKHKKMNKDINPYCWKIVQEKRKELQKKKTA